MGNMWQLSQDAEGTFVVQRALDECTNDAERAAIANEMQGHVFDATQCPHANHVLRKAISVLPPLALNFVIDEIVALGSSGILELARHRYGCRILEELVTQVPLDGLEGIVENLLLEAPTLCTHIYGNFVMQRLLEHSPVALRSRLLRMVHGNVVAMGTDFYGSAMISKTMMHADPIEKLQLARAILGVDGLLAAIVRFRNGKSVADLVLSTLEGAERDFALKSLSAPRLKVAKAGRSR